MKLFVENLYAPLLVSAVVIKYQLSNYFYTFIHSEVFSADYYCFNGLVFEEICGVQTVYFLMPLINMYLLKYMHYILEVVIKGS